MSDVPRPFELRVPADPAMGVTVRVFVTEAARRSGLAAEDVDDLRLAATELLANAVETGQLRLELAVRVDGDRWYLRATGAGELRAEPDAVVARAALLEGLAEVRLIDGAIEISSPLSARDAVD